MAASSFKGSAGRDVNFKGTTYALWRRLQIATPRVDNINRTSFQSPIVPKPTSACRLQKITAMQTSEISFPPSSSAGASSRSMAGEKSLIRSGDESSQPKISPM